MKYHKTTTHKNLVAITDLVGNNTIITQTNGAFAQAGISGSTSVFTSTDSSGTQKLSFTYDASSDLAAIIDVEDGGWTIEEWINIKGLNYPQTPAGSVFSSPAYGTGAVGFDWNHGNSMGMGTLRVGASDGGGSGYEVQDNLTVDTNLSVLDKWQCRQLIWNRDDGAITNYINGIYQDTGNISSLSSPLYDGGGATIGTLYGWFHYGDRGVTKIYNRVLSTSELLQNFNGLKNRYEL